VHGLSEGQRRRRRRYCHCLQCAGGTAFQKLPEVKQLGRVARAFKWLVPGVERRRPAVVGSLTCFSSISMAVIFNGSVLLKGGSMKRVHRNLSPQQKQERADKDALGRPRVQDASHRYGSSWGGAQAPPLTMGRSALSTASRRSSALPSPLTVVCWPMASAGRRVFCSASCLNILVFSMQSVSSTF
jgi:hypothetical protein